MKRTAFTLIELLVVVAIISLLVSVLAPSLRKAKALAWDVECLQNLHNLSVAIHFYTAENDNMFPYASWHDANNPNTEYWTDWWKRVGRMPAGSVKNKPASLQRIHYNGYVDWHQSPDDDSVFLCPTARREVQPQRTKPLTGYAHYGMNEFIEGEQEHKAPWTVTCYREDEFHAWMVLVADAHIAWGNHAQAYYFWSGMQLNPNWYAYDAWPLQLHISGQPNPFYGHSGHTANVARVNGSAKPETELTWEDFVPREILLKKR
jgi:prepilin-type N-terminal cleavage/methylation domain-containing protein